MIREERQNRPLVPPNQMKGTTMEKKNRKFVAAAALAMASVAALTGCASDADRATVNLSKSAEQFEIERRITSINGITDTVIMEIEGRCSVETGDSGLAGALEVTCKVGEDQYKKNFVYLSDNTVVSVEQLDPIDVSVYHYRYIIKPENILPEFDLEAGEQ